jgi:RHS repeat-associated protein
VTNLRLPGQYDERLFAAAGISGLAGPYYNWNRWYLPSMGRYMELDPIALRGHQNGPFGADWYGYSRSNPILNVDPAGSMSPAFNTELMKAMARQEASDWMVEMWSDWSVGGATGLLCAARACKAHNVPRAYFDAYGDCIAILESFGIPMGLEPSDLFVNACAENCTRLTNSSQFKGKCRGLACAQ